ARGDEVRLRTQYHAVVDHLEGIGCERRAGCGDIDDQFGGAGGRRALGRTRGCDDAVVGDAVRGEEGAREIAVLGGGTHFAVVVEAECSREVVEIGHRINVNAGLGDGDRHVGVAEAEGVDEHDLGVRVGDHLAYQVFAGDAEMHHALRQEIGDLRGREIGDLNVGEISDGATVVAGAARLDQFEPGAG